MCIYDWSRLIRARPTFQVHMVLPEPELLDGRESAGPRAAWGWLAFRGRPGPRAPRAAVTVAEPPRRYVTCRGCSVPETASRGRKNSTTPAWAWPRYSGVAYDAVHEYVPPSLPPSLLTSLRRISQTVVRR